MAVLRQQRAFAADLYERGAVDEDEREALNEAVDAAMRHLDMTGAVQGARVVRQRRATPETSATTCRCPPARPLTLPCIHRLAGWPLPPACQHAGPIWRPPAPDQVLRSLDVFSGAPRELVDWLLAQAQLEGAWQLLGLQYHKRGIRRAPGRVH